MPKISIIVPVYNVEKYLQRCVDSILAQTFTDFELILIDDGSPDNSGAICDDYQKKDGRVCVIHKANGGVSSARNAGILKACGEFITFIDSDDWVESEFLVQMMEGNEDFLCQTAVSVGESGKILDYAKHKNVGYFTLTQPTLVKLLLQGDLDLTVCKRYKKSIIAEHNILFNENVDLAEDTLFTVQYLKYAKDASVTNISNYKYVIYRSRETLSNSYNSDRVLVLSKANHLICGLISGENTEEEKNIFLKRMTEPYNEMVRSEMFRDKKNILQATLYLYNLSADREFMDYVNHKDCVFFPSRTKTAMQKRSRYRIFVSLIYWKIIRKMQGVK